MRKYSTAIGLKLNFGMMIDLNYGLKLILTNSSSFKLQELLNKLQVILTGLSETFMTCSTTPKI